MILSLLPAQAMAAGDGQPTAIEAVTATAVEESGTLGDITVRTANVFCFAPNDNYISIPLEVEGLPAGSWRAQILLDGGQESTRGLMTESSGVSTASYPISSGLSAGAHQLSVTIFSSDKTITYSTVTLPVYLAAATDLPIPVEELNRDNYVSVYERKPYVRAAIPVGTLDGSQKYSVRLLQGGEVVGSTIPTVSMSVIDTTIVDYRYDDVYREGHNIRYDVQTIGSTLYVQTPLTADGGLCSLEISNGDEVVYTVPNAIAPVELPLVDGMDLPYNLNMNGQTSLWCAMNITGGDPNQFQVKAYQEGVLKGTSQGYRITYVNDSEIRVEYEVSLAEPLEEGSRYTVVAERSDGGSFVGQRQNETYISNSAKIMDGIFPSHYYANVILDTAGLDPMETYKLTLKNTSQQELAWTMASPDVNGRFDVEFLGEDGKPLRLSPNTQCQLEIYRKNQASDQWELAATSWISNQGIEESALQPMSADTPLELNLNYSNAMDSDDGVIWVNFAVNGADTLPENLELFQLRLNGVVAGTLTLDPTDYDRRDYGNITYLDLYYEAPEGASWYWTELLYDGGEVINSKSGENALADNYPLQSNEVVRAYASNGSNESGLYFVVGISGRNLGEQDVELRLYQYGNQSLTPDAVLTLTQEEGYDITEAHVGELDLGLRYQGELWMNGKPVGVDSNYSYVNARESVFNWDKVSYTATAEPTANGTLELLTIPKNEDGSIPALNEVYVRAVADSGYQLKAGSIKVNGQPILGRSFLLTEDSTVTAEFEPIPAETYPVEVVEDLYKGTLKPDVTRAAQGQTVTVTAVPEYGWEAYAVKCYAGAPYSGETISLTQTGTNTYTFVMPAEPVYLSATFIQMSTYEIQTSGQVTGGSFTHPASAYAGERVEFTAVADWGHYLEPTTLRVRFPYAGGTDTDVPVTAVEGKANTYCFTMPAYDVEIYGMFYTSDLPTYQVLTFSAQGGTVYPVGGESYCPGDTVTIEARANDGYALETGSVKASWMGDSIQNLKLTDLGDDQWQFTMPEAEVTLSARFTVTDTTAEVTVETPEHGTLSASDAVLGQWVTVTAVPDTGYVTDKITVTFASGKSVEALRSNGSYTFLMEEREAAVSAVFSPIPRQEDLLVIDTVARSAGDWYLSLQLPEEISQQLGQLNWESLFLQAQIVDQAGQLVSRQERNREGYGQLNLTNCGLAAGSYTVYVIAGDADHMMALGWDTLHVVDGMAYNGYSGRNQLTGATKALDAEFNLTCAVTDLKGTYTATLRDEAGMVYASSSDYQIVYYGENSKGTAGGDESTVGSNTLIRFRLPITGTLTKDHVYHLELESSGGTMVSQGYTNDLYVTDGVMILEGVYDKVTRIWTAQTENLAPGTYSAVCEVYNGYDMEEKIYPAVVDADGVITVNDPLDGLENISRSFELRNNNGDYLVSFNVSSDSGGNTVWYYIALEGARYALYNPSAAVYYNLVYPMSASRTIQAKLNGAVGGGSWRLYLETATGNQLAASGEVSDLSAFSFTVPESTDQSEQRYSLEVLDGENNRIAQSTFAFTSSELLTTEKEFRGHVGAGTESLTVWPMNHDPEDPISVFMGYRDSLGVHALPVTDNGDGSWTVDLSQVPYGSYKPVLGLYGKADDSLNVSWSFRRASIVKEQLPEVTVAWPLLSSDDSGNTLATVTYDGGVPASDVTMHIYTLEDETATFLRSVKIGRGAYTINSGTLGLDGACLFCFTLEDGTSIGQWSASMGMLSVTFLDWNGSILDTQQVAYGQSAVPPAAPQRDGYVFTGWSGSCINVTENRVLTARYAPETLTVTFFPAGGTGDLEAQSVLYGGTATDPKKEPIREGYTFTGWYIAPSGGKPFDFDTPLYADTVLYAGWKEKEYSITLAEGTQVEQLLINGELREGSSWAALPGDLVEVRFASTPRPLSLRVTQSDEVWMDLTPYADGNGWSCLFNMSEYSVTLSAQYGAAGTLKIEAESEVMEYLLYSASGMYLGSENESQVPVGTYTLEVWLSDGQHCRQENVIISQGQTTTVMIQSQTRHTVTFQVVSEPNPSLPVGLTLSVYGMGTGGDRMYYVDAVSVQNGEASISLPDGQYFLAASSGQISESTKTFTVSGQSVSHSVTLEWGMDIQLDLRCTNGWVSGTAYLQVESKLANGEWAIMYATSVGTSGTFLLEGVIMERDWEYRLRLVELYDQRGIQQQTVSEPVKFDPNAGGKVYLTYQLQQNNIPNFSGEGNGVLLSRGSAYPGDTVELIVRYNGTVAPEAFAVRLPDGLTDLNGTTSLTLTPDGEKQGTVRAMLKVADTAQRGNYSIPVTVTAGGKDYDFSAAVLTVDRPTLSGPAMAKAGESFNVYGEAPEGSKVTIRGASGKVYAIVVSSGRFYSGTVTLSGTDTLIGEVAVGSAAVQTNELEVMMTEEQPLALTGVSYGTYGSMTDAVWNSKLNSYLFNQYVDMELKGFDLRFSASFNREDVYSVLYHFCGQEYPAAQNSDGTWTADFSQGTWGGAGLKEITATVVMSSSSGYYNSVNVPVAIVNLLVDPSGVITDENGKPLEGVTVRCQVWDETANGWKDLDAAAIGQTNPQVTDSEGRYGWYVPEGKYRVLAFKEGYLDYDSSQHEDELDWDGTIPPARTDISFSMTPAKSTYTVYPTAVTGGTVEAADSAKAGETVTLTVDPEAGLQVASVTVLTLSGASVPVDKGQAENTYTFTMPYADVTYSVAFSGTQQTSVSIASADADGQVRVTISGLLENARLMAAYYDKDGRMLGVDVQEVKAGTGTVQMNVPVSGTAVKVSVFLLDHEQKPLVPSTDRQLN